MSNRTGHSDDICPTRMARGLFGMVFAVAGLGLLGGLFNDMAAGPSVAPALTPVAPVFAPSLGYGL